MNSDWISAQEAAAILEITHFAVLRLGNDGALTGRRVRVPGARGSLQWEFLRGEVEARRAAMRCSREESGLGSDWIDVNEAMQTIGIQRNTLYAWVREGLLTHQGIGPKGKRRSYFLKSDCERLATNPPLRLKDFCPPDIMAIPEECAWLAGFFDGEGCVQIHCRTNGLHYMEIVLGNTALDALHHIRDVFGGTVSPRCPSATHRRPQWYWKAASHHGYSVLMLIRPYLRVKHRQADLAIEFQERIARFHPSPAYPLTEGEKIWRARQRFYVRCLNNPKKLPLVI